MSADLFRSSDILVRARLQGSTGPLVISFDCYTNTHDLGRPGYGEKFFAKRKISAIHILTKNNTWYQHHEMTEVLRLTREIARRYDRIVTYGSSMGGYAAIRFGHQLGAVAAMAVAPQYSVDPRVCAYEKRWHEPGWIDFCVEQQQPIEAIGECIVVYDPYDRLDRRHVELIEKDQPLTHVRIPFAGHSTGLYLSEIGLMNIMITDLVENKFDAISTERSARAGRYRAAKYYETLSRHAEARHARWALLLAKKAASIRPDNAVYLNRVAQLLEQAGDIGDAAHWQRKALALQPENAFFLLDLSRILLKTDCFSESIDLADKVLALNERNADAHYFRAEALFKNGDLAAASTSGQRALQLNPMHRWYQDGCQKFDDALALWRSRLVRAW